MDLATMERRATLLRRDSMADVLELAALEENDWNGRLGRIAGPKAGFGPFRQMLDGAISLADQTAVTGTTEVAMWPVAQYTGFGPNQLRAGQVWCLSARGVMSTAGSSQGNITITPRFGTTSGGVALGASAATALVASASNVAWRLQYDFEIRTVGLAGANSTMEGNGVFMTTVAAIAASTGNVVPFSSTASVSVDLSIAAGIYIGVTMGSASDTLKTLFVGLESLN
jgi:hypothetical protein